MSFKRIKPILTGKQAHTLKKPSLFRACINFDLEEYKLTESKIYFLYQKANQRDKINSGREKPNK